MRIDGIAAPPSQVQGTKDNRVDSAGQEFQKILDKAIASKEDKQLKEAAKQFEALFIYQMYSKMRETIDKGGLFEEDLASGIFQGMLDQEVSTKAAETGGFGLADVIYQQLKRK